MQEISFARSKKNKSNLNMTPLIDVIFLLIVFFLLTSKFIVVESISLDLTSTNQQDTVIAAQESILIQILPQGKFAISGKEGEIKTIGNYLHKNFGKIVDRSIVLELHDNVLVQDMVTAMDFIKIAGGTEISLAYNE